MPDPLVYNGKELHAWDTVRSGYASPSILTLTGFNPKQVFTRLWANANRLFYIILEPGDGTRYAFGICLTDAQRITIIQYTDDSFSEIVAGFTCHLHDNVDFEENRFINPWTFKVMKHYFKLMQEESFIVKQYS